MDFPSGAATQGDSTSRPTAKLHPAVTTHPPITRVALVVVLLGCSLLLGLATRQIALNGASGAAPTATLPPHALAFPSLFTFPTVHPPRSP